MEVQVSSKTAKKLNDLAASSGRAPGDIVEDALAGYLEEMAGEEPLWVVAVFHGRRNPRLIAAVLRDRE